MPDLEVTIFNQKLKLSYQENEKQRLVNAVKILNKNWNNYSELQGKVSDLKIITLISLELQDSIGDYSSLKDKLTNHKLNIEKLKKEIEEKNKEYENSTKIINKFKIDIEYKNKEISKIENILDEMNDELLKIKNNILANKNE